MFHVMLQYFSIFCSNVKTHTYLIAFCCLRNNEHAHFSLQRKVLVRCNAFISCRMARLSMAIFFVKHRNFRKIFRLCWYKALFARYTAQVNCFTNFLVLSTLKQDLISSCCTVELNLSAITHVLHFRNFRVNGRTHKVPVYHLIPTYVPYVAIIGVNLALTNLSEIDCRFFSNRCKVHQRNFMLAGIIVTTDYGVKHHFLICLSHKNGVLRFIFFVKVFGRYAYTGASIALFNALTHKCLSDFGLIAYLQL